MNEKKAKELSLKKGKFLLSLPDYNTLRKWIGDNDFVYFMNDCPLCELYLLSKQRKPYHYCSIRCPIRKNELECWKTGSLYDIYCRSIYKDYNRIEAMKRLIKIVREWEV
jgi:hypothetical protein